MDFASLMSKEISKSKTPPASSSTSDKQYIKKSEVEAARLAAYNAEQEKSRREREERAELKRKFDDEEAERNHQREEKKRRLAEESRRKREAEQEEKEKVLRKRLGLGEATNSDAEKDGTPVAADQDLDDDELTTKLRSMGEPVQLFGESHKGRLKRYRRLVERSSTPQTQLTDGPIPTTLSLVPEAEMKVAEKIPTDKEGREYLFRQLASYFTMVLKEWEIALAKRDNAVKQTLQGRQAYNAMVQSRENLRPLFKKFENDDLAEGILDPVVEIVRNAQNRRYVDANDGYLRVSIGKA